MGCYWRVLVLLFIDLLSRSHVVSRPRGWSDCIPNLTLSMGMEKAPVFFVDARNRIDDSIEESHEF